MDPFLANVHRESNRQLSSNADNLSNSETIIVTLVSSLETVSYQKRDLTWQKTNNECVSREESDQPVHPFSLI